ncbi:RNase A-like domain-containing protein [Streptomyces xanthochromogenes]|uniref:RNase A-like domain-containing protein n=1 Tax=Streptomyces xanthochromogenes TaxID=67384 RepID=UPI0038162DA2
MSAGDTTREIVTDVTGIDWPAGDVGKLRDIATAWRQFADDMEDVAAAANKAAQALIHNNKGEAIEAFANPFWARYYQDKRGWLQDLVDGPRDLAKGIDSYADAVDDAKKKLDHELEIAGAAIVVGTGLAIFTLGISEAAAAAATTAIIELATTVGVTLTTEVATIAGTAFATAAISGIESVTIDLAVAQPLKMAAGVQSGGFNLDEAQDSLLYGAVAGGAFGGIGKTFQVANEGGWNSLLGGLRVPALGPGLAMPGGLGGEAGDLGMLLRDGEPNAWPRSKRKGPVNPKYRADLAGDEGNNGSHTIDRHVEMTTRDLRSRLRTNPGMEAASRYIDEGSAQRFADGAMLKHQKEIGEWLAGTKKKMDFSEHFDEATGLSLTRENFKRGTAAQWVNGVQVVLKRDPSAAAGYRILTSYPIP